MTSGDLKRANKLLISLKWDMPIEKRVLQQSWTITAKFSLWLFSLIKIIVIIISSIISIITGYAVQAVWMGAVLFP